MLRGPLDYASNAWREIEKYTYYFTYEQTILKIADCYPHAFRDVIDEYSKQSSRQAHTLKADYIERNPDLVKQNVLLLKNSIELWNTAKNTSDAVSPILFHYSFNCFNSFFLYSFLKWTQQRTQGHGLSLEWDDDFGNIKVIINNSGLFPRILDIFTVFGVPLAFAKFIPINDSGKIQFIENNNLFQNDDGKISISELLRFDSREVIGNFNIKDNEQIIPTFLLKANVSINTALSSFLLVFLASSIARYRPALWQSILPGDNELRRDFMDKYSLAITQYTVGENGFGFIWQVRDMLWKLSEQKFRFNDYNLINIF